jgi:uncharacterized protein involved in exopolysaccharide biosynthesis
VDINNINSKLISDLIKKDFKYLTRVFLIFAILGVLVSLLITPRYDSRISFYTKKNDGSSNFSSLDLSQIMLSGSPVMSNHDFSILDILSSNDIYERLIFHKFESINSNLVEFWKNKNRFFVNLLLDGNDQRVVINTNVKKIKSRISYLENRKSGLISIKVTTEDKFLSKELAQVLFDDISNLLIEVNSQKYDEKVSFLGKLSKQYKEDLTIEENALVDFLVKNKNIDKSEALLAKRNSLERKINVTSSTYYSMLRDLEMAKISQSDAMPLLVILDEPKLAHKKSYPPRKIIVLIFGFFGASFALGLKILNLRIKNTI